jgi:O-antigen/teichoic acid export membrane protein
LATGNQERYTALALAMSVIVNILLNLVLIPKYGGVGAAIATVLAEFFLCLVYAKLFYSKILQFEWNYITPILRGFIMMILLGVTVQILDFSLISRIAFLVISYPIVVWLAGIYPADAVHTIRNFIQEMRKTSLIKEETLA